MSKIKKNLKPTKVVASKSESSKLSKLPTPAISLLVFVVSILISLLYMWPVRYMPFHLDGARLIVNGALTLSETYFEPLALTQLGVSHPPGLMLYLALVWQVFGDSRVVTHLAMVPFLSLFLISSFYMFYRFTSLVRSLMLMFVLAFLPVVVSQFQMLSVPLSMAALANASLALWFYRQHVWALLVLSLATWFSPVALLIWPVLILDYLAHRSKLRPQTLFLPVGSLGIWYLYHNSVAGFWMIPPESGWSLPSNILVVVQFGFFVLQRILLSEFYALISVPLIIGLAWLGLTKDDKLKRSRLVPMLIVGLLLTGVYYGVVGEFSTIRTIFLLPLLLLTTVWVLTQATGKLVDRTSSGWLVGVFIVLVGFVSLTQWKVDRSAGYEIYFAPETNMVYLDRINVGQNLAGYLEVNHPNAQVYGGYPEDYQLTQVHQGYVRKPFDFRYCSQFELDEKQQQLIIVNPYHFTQLACDQLLTQVASVPLERIVQGKRWSQVYLVTATASATPVEE